MFITNWLQSLFNSTTRRERRPARRPARLTLPQPLEERLLLAAIVWDGEAGDNSWGTAENWFDQTNQQNNVLPTAIDDAVIGSEFSAERITIPASTTITVRSVNSQAELLIDEAATFELSADSQVDRLTHRGSYVRGNNTATLTVAGALEWARGNIAEIDVVSQDSLSIGAEHSVAVADVTLTNEGNAIWHGHSMTVSGFTLVNRGTFEVRSDALINDFGGGGTIHNESGATWTNAAGPERLTLSLFGGTRFQNDGTFEVQEGTVAVRPHESGGTFNVADGAELEFIYTGGLTDTSIINSDGTLTFGGTTSVAGVVNVTGPVNVTGTVTFERDTTVPTLHHSGHVVRGNNAATLTVTDQLDWARGSFAEITVVSQDSLNIGTEHSVTMADTTLINEGVGVWHDHSITASGSVLTNRGTLEVRTDSNIGDYQAAANTIRNEAGAQWTKTGGTGAQWMGSWERTTFENQGTLTIESGELILPLFTQAGGTTDVAAGASAELRTLDGGLLTGEGTISGDLTQTGGTIRPGGDSAGALTITGDLDQSGGTVDVQIGGTIAGTSFDQLIVDGTATSLEGTLNAAWLGPYRPTGGESYAVLSGATSNTFAVTELPDLPAGLDWEVASGSVLLNVTGMLQESGGVSGVRFRDSNGNGEQDAGEVGLDGLTIELIDPATGDIVASTTTFSRDLNGDGVIDPVGESGLYEVRDLAAGDYRVRAVRQAGWLPTLPTEVHFAEPQSYGASAHPNDIVAAHLDGDAFIDLAVTDPDSDAVTVLRNHGDGSFSTLTTIGFAISSAPSALAAANLDGDPIVDLAAIRRDREDLIRLSNDGHGGFASTGQASVDSGPRAVTAADFDGDGRTDLAIARALNYDSFIGRLHHSSVAVVSNVPGGALPITDVYTGPLHSGPESLDRSITTADLDGDGRPDIVVADAGLEVVTTLRNNGDGTFTKLEDVDAAGPPAEVAAADLDGDGDTDLLVGRADRSGLRMLLNAGDGTFPNSRTVSVPATPSDIVLGDFDHDRDIDFAVAAAGESRVFLGLNDGSGVFTNLPGPLVGDLPQAITAADLDSDGDIDLVTVNTGSGDVSVLENLTGEYTVTVTDAVVENVDFGEVSPSIQGRKYHDENGNGQRDPGETGLDGWTIELLEPSTGELIATATTFSEDVNGDGSIDPETEQGLYEFPGIVPGDYRIRDVLQPGWRRTAPGTISVRLSDIFRLNTDDAPRSIIGADLDGDGDDDYAVTNGDADTVTILMNHGQGEFQESQRISTGDSPRFVTAADVDGDGDPDLIVSRSAAADNVRILMNDGTGTFAAGAAFTAGEGSLEVAAADLDNDGSLDLVVASRVSDDVSILRNDGAGGYINVQVVSVVDEPVSVAIVDVDGDRDLDVAVARFGAGGSGVAILRNNGMGGFQWTDDVTAGTQPIAVVAADFDDDGDSDLAVANRGSLDVSMLINDGRGVFTKSSDVPVGLGPDSLVAVDVDGDADIDLAVAGQSSGRVAMLLNDGDGGLTQAGDVSLAQGLSQIITSDIDGDGVPELLVANQVTDEIAILANHSGTWAVSLGTEIRQGYHFGNVLPTVSGQKYHDADFDGERDADEIGLDGWTIELVDPDTGDVVATTVTNSRDVNQDEVIDPVTEQGLYEFTGFVPGRYRVREVPQPGWWQTSAAEDLQYSVANFNTDSQGSSLATGDFDGDGDTDVAIANYGLDTLTLVYNTDGRLGDPRTMAVGDGPVAVTAADFDGDGDMDLAVGNYLSGDVTVLSNDGFGTFESQTVEVGASAQLYALVSADLDGDGDVDMATVNRGSIDRAVSLLRNEGGTFVVEDIAATRRAWKLAAKDMDGDGDIDLATDQYVLTNVDNQSFTQEMTQPAGYRQSMIVGDWNGDGLADRAMLFSGYVYVYFNDGAGGIRSEFVAYYSPSQPRGLVTFDADADGDLDLALARRGFTSRDFSGVTMLLNDGDGSFTPGGDFLVSGFANLIASADFSGDGRPDPLLVNNAGDMSILTSVAGTHTAVAHLAPIRNLDFGNVERRQVVSGQDVTVPERTGFDVTLEYTATDYDFSLNGLGLRLHYDSSVLSYTGANLLMSRHFIVQQDVPDVVDFDADPSTDRYVLFAWSDPGRSWPGPALSKALLSARFEATVDAQPGESTVIRTTASSTSPTHGFLGEPMTVEIIASTLDIDQNGTADALTDGTLIVRYLQGRRGHNLIDGALAADAVRDSVDDITRYLDQVRTLIFDLDGNGQATVAEGQAVQDYLFGFRGCPLVDGVLAEDAVRESPIDIALHLDAYHPDPWPTPPISGASGTLFHDLNGDGIRDAGEAGWIGHVYIDDNNNGVHDSGEFIVEELIEDRWCLDLDPGTYVLRATTPEHLGMLPTVPGGAHTVTLSEDEWVVGLDFGFQSSGGAAAFVGSGDIATMAGGSTGGPLAVLPGGTLTGAGTVNGTLANGGLVSPGNSPERILVEGEFRQDAGGELLIELGGRTPVTEHDVVTVTGVAHLDGTLKIALIDEFLPQRGDTFTVLSYASRTGEFDSVVVSDLPDDLALDLDYDDTALTVRVSGARSIEPVEGPAAGVTQQPLRFTTDFGNDNAIRQSTIDWGDGTSDTGTLVESAAGGTISGSHVWDAAGDYTIRIELTDEFGNVIATESLVTISDWAAIEDPQHPRRQMIVLGGTVDDDWFALSTQQRRSQLAVRVNAEPLGPWPIAAISRVVAFGGAGRDAFRVSRHISVPLEFHGGDGADRIDGGDGPDVIDGGEGDDWIRSGGGDDRIDAGPGDNVVDSGEGDDHVRAGSGDDQIHTRSGDDTILAGDGRNRIRSGAGDDVIHSGAGDDFVSAGRGHDVVMTGAGDDRIRAGRGNDFVTAGAGNDVVQAAGGDDILVGAEGRDWLSGGRGQDLAIGGEDSDRLAGNAGDDLLIDGRTTYDQNPDAVTRIHEEWTSGRTVEVRADNIRRGSGPVLSGTGIGLTASDATPNDNAVDRLFGHAGIDWLFDDSDDDLFA